MTLRTITAIAMIGTITACAGTHQHLDDVHDRRVENRTVQMVDQDDDHGMHMDERGEGERESEESRCQRDTDCGPGQICEQRLIPSCPTCPGGISIPVCVNGSR